MDDDAGPSALCESCYKLDHPDALNSQRVFKKSSPNNKLTLYLSSRDLVVSSGKIDRIQGVLLVDPEFVEQRNVYGQVTLTFRYGREDEEVMGLKFCNEAIMCLAQLYPPHLASQGSEGNTPLQEALLRRLGPNAYPFNMEITPMAPPSVQLVPAKEYSGAPIGTSYDVRAYVADRAGDKFQRRIAVRMGIRVVQRAYVPVSTSLLNLSGPSVFGPKDRNKAKYVIRCGRSPQRNRECESPRHPDYPPLQEQATIEENEPTATSADENNRLNANKLDNVKPEIVLNDSFAINGDVDGTTHDGNENEGVTAKNNITGPGEIDDADGVHENENRQIGQTDLNSSDNENSHSSDNLKVTPCKRKRRSIGTHLADIPAPHLEVTKPFLLSEGRIHLTASLNKAIYSHGEEVLVNVHIKNNSNKTIKRIKVFIAQHVDVCMFSNGKFKNVVAMINSKEHCPISSGSTLDTTYRLIPTKSSTKNWIALEDSYTKSGTNLASTVTCTTNNPDERNVFAIYVSYYVKVKLMVSVMGGEVSLKLPFALMHSCAELDPCPSISRMADSAHIHLDLQSASPEIKPEKDGT